MTSHPAVGNHPPPQQRNVGVARPPQGSQSTAQLSSSVPQRGRKRALDADGTTEVADSRMQDGQSKLRKTLTGTLAIPAFAHALQSPEAGHGSPQTYKQFQADFSSRHTKPDQNTPFPSRPGQNGVGLGGTAQLGIGETGVVQKIELRLYTGEAPAMAKRYPQGQPADCSFWKGVHVEDNLAEQTIKSGFQNKSLLSNETNTARPSIWSHLKKQGGPQTLSSLFVTLLEKRQTTGRVTGPSTFKPPPRLTMSNTRRESFLRELADPSWPMRKLNRSVPHTISGRLLLEQCLSKDIPTSRAVWLAKCIGANDIRAFKRKWASGATAMGSEAKWIKEWTIHVEQFVKGTFGGIGEPDWKAKFEYVLRLSSHLFFEQLLDHDHYLDWVITSFETSSLEHLPAWLLLVQIYWDSLVCNRKRGRRITEGLLGHLEQFSSEEIGDLIQPLLGKMQSLLIILAVSHKGCLILPRTWSKFRDIIQSIPSTAENPGVSSAIDNLTTRNDRLALRAGTGRVHHPEKEILTLLDTARIDESISQLASRCVEVGADVSTLVRTVLRWAASVYRQGDHRVYIAAVLLCRFKDHHSEIDAAIWNVAAGLESDPGIHEIDVCRVVGELVRSRQFSVGPFLRYLISTGAVSSPHDPTKPLPPLLRLLQHLPDHDLPEEVSNLRKILLQSAELAYPVEDVSSANFQIVVLAQISHAKNAGDWAFPKLELMDLHLCQRFPLAIWLRDLMLSNIDNEPDSADQSTSNGLSTITAAQGTFCVIRDALEKLQDYPCLADVLEITLETDDQHLLTSITDTINYGYRCFVALGAMKSIFNKLVDRYEAMRSRHMLMKPFCLALLKLCSTLDADQSLVAQLNQDLVRCDQLNAAAICSPASDNAELFHASYADSDEEIERILWSGTMMDEQMVDRVFKRITSRVEEHYKTAEARVPFGQWLLRLRGFDEHTFDLHMRDWISSLLSRMDMWKMLYNFVLPGAVGSGCLSLGDFVQCAEQCAQALTEKDLSFQCCFQVEFLKALLPDPDLSPQCGIPEAYKYRLERRTFALSGRSIIFSLLNRLLGAEQNALSDDAKHTLDNIFERPGLLYVIREHALVSEDACQELDNLFHGLALSNTSKTEVRRLVELLLDPRHLMALDQLPPQDIIELLVTSADELSLPFCMLELRCLFHIQPISPKSPAIESLEHALFLSVANASEDGSGVCFEVLARLDASQKRRICELSEAQVMSTVTIPSSDEQVTPQTTNIQLQKYLRIIDCTSQGSLHDQDASFTTVIIEKLTNISDILLSPDSDDIVAKSNEKQTRLIPDIENLCHWIESLLHLSVLHKNLSEGQKSPASDHSALLSALCTILMLPQLQEHPETLEYVFDVSALLADDLSDEQRSIFARFESQRLSDPRIFFLLGSSPLADGWLGLVTSQNPVGAATSASGSVGTPGRTGQSQPVQGASPAWTGPQPVTRPQPGQRTAAGSSQQKLFNPPVQYPLKRWELLPDQGSTGAVNDTAISLSLFGARKAQ